ncbi:MAG: hypothetical protein IT445_12190 [Phycisphaeraceae bacterium]|nr:hypothetical protein [Phycisphaeraceae bacterium]
MPHNKPEKTFKAGAVRASIFVNTYQKDGQKIPIRKVVLEVRYRDKHGVWKSSSSLSLNELPKAITALQQAYEYLLHPPPPEVPPSPEVDHSKHHNQDTSSFQH